jgi:hypothetical protein
MASPQAMELEGKDVVSKGHEVVVMPTSAFGGMNSVRDLVSSRNGGDDQPHYRKPRRSRSAGRTVSRSRDIVQDVYDRMGVSFPRGALLIDEKSNNETVASGIEARTAAPARGREASTGRHDRGRSDQVDPEREQRARSLSRGRMQQRWQTAVTTRDPTPISQRPTLAGSGSDKAVPLTPVSASKRAVSTATTPVRQAPPTPVRQAPGTPVRQAPGTPVRQAPGTPVRQAPITPVRPATVIPSVRRTPTSNNASNIERRDYALSERRDLPGSDRKRQSAAAAMSHLLTPDLKDEKKEGDSDMGEESKNAQRRLSIKDRISAYRGKETAATSRNVGNPSRPRRSFSTLSSPQYMSNRELPPKVNIYGTESDGMTTGMTCDDASRAEVEAAPDPPVENSVRSARTTGRVADVFLAAISPVKAAPSSSRAYRGVPKSIPAVEINGHSYDETGAADAQSLAASSVSGDDYHLNSPKHASRNVIVGLPMKKNSLKPDIHKYGSTRNIMTGMTINSQNNSSTPTNATPELEKLVEDRVQAQLSDMESRFEGRLARMETQMENQHKEHVFALEAKLDQLHSLLTTMAASGSQSSSTLLTKMAKKGPGDKQLLMLLSNQSGNRRQVADQDRAQTMLKVQGIDMQLLDGSDPNHKPRRDELFGISGIRANYPQFFLVGDSITTYLGNFEMIEGMNDLGTLTNDNLGTS